jgi:hypothetical protein
MRRGFVVAAIGAVGMILAGCASQNTARYQKPGATGYQRDIFVHDCRARGIEAHRNAYNARLRAGDHPTTARAAASVAYRQTFDRCASRHGYRRIQ